MGSKKSSRTELAMKLDKDKFYNVKFYDHAQDDNSDTPVTLEIHKGRLIKNTKRYYFFDVVSCSLEDNSCVWKVLKSTIYDVYELEDK